MNKNKSGIIHLLPLILIGLVIVGVGYAAYYFGKNSDTPIFSRPTTEPKAMSDWVVHQGDGFSFMYPSHFEHNYFEKFNSHVLFEDQTEKDACVDFYEENGKLFFLDQPNSPCLGNAHYITVNKMDKSTYEAKLSQEKGLLIESEDWSYYFIEAAGQYRLVGYKQQNSNYRSVNISSWLTNRQYPEYTKKIEPLYLQILSTFGFTN